MSMSVRRCVYVFVCMRHAEGHGVLKVHGKSHECDYFWCVCVVVGGVICFKRNVP